MLNTLQIPDFEMHSMDQALNFKLVRNGLEKNDHLEHPLVKMQNDTRLQNLRLHPKLRKFFTNPPRTNCPHPP